MHRVPSAAVIVASYRQAVASIHISRGTPAPCHGSAAPHHLVDSVLWISQRCFADQSHSPDRSSPAARPERCRSRAARAPVGRTRAARARAAPRRSPGIRLGPAVNTCPALHSPSWTACRAIDHAVGVSTSKLWVCSTVEQSRSAAVSRSELDNLRPAYAKCYLAKGAR
jgi:hypothetical protein